MTELAKVRNGRNCGRSNLLLGTEAFRIRRWRTFSMSARIFWAPAGRIRQTERSNARKRWCPDAERVTMVRIWLSYTIVTLTPCAVLLLASHGYDAYGLEVSEGAIEQCQEVQKQDGNKYPVRDTASGAGTVNYILGDFFSDTWAKVVDRGDSFDLIYDYTVCEDPLTS